MYDVRNIFVGSRSFQCFSVQDLFWDRSQTQQVAVPKKKGAVPGPSLDGHAFVVLVTQSYS